MTSTRTGRWVRLDGTTNMRDLGGLPTADGGRTVAGRVLRSDNLQTLTPSDVRVLVEEIGLREVVDLRTTAEILLEGRGPLREVPEVVHRHFSLLPERGHHTDVFAVEEDEVPELPEGWVESLLPRRRRSTRRTSRRPCAPTSGYLHDRAEAVVGAVRALAQAEDGASVVHCAAGKDRTGVVVALCLAVAGVPHEEIVADYAMTADDHRRAGRQAGRLTHLRRGHGAARRRPAHARGRRRWSACSPCSTSAHGGPAGWLREHGFGAAEQAVLRARLRD